MPTIAILLLFVLVIMLPASQKWTNPGFLQGTKRPQRLFFTPMLAVAENGNPLETQAEAWFAHSTSAGLQTPQRLAVHRVPPGGDLGSSGLWNHNEFFVRLLALKPAARWQIADCRFEHISVQHVWMTGIAQNLGRPGEVPAADQPAASSTAEQPASSSTATSDVDWSFFEAPMLTAAGPKGFNPHDFLGGSDEGFFQEDEDELFDQDLNSDQEGEGVSHNPDVTAGPKAGSDKEDVDAKSDSGMSHASAASHRSHTAATDHDLLQSILGSRPFFHKFFRSRQLRHRLYCTSRFTALGRKL